ncbi:hypothetical protein [Streptomyces sp. NBC_01445]|uniref:hypothetical protein n=1 Tax=Streptomyces sp. NBC_01445 TaxID=2903869 RepID=UPI002DDA9656|nr:hypothetical protein [Streptomyces sp. NBC_01445]WSE02139.1 hypothetical protein OG574_01090 [Streptomyces sp. NBC_01445]
MAWWLVREWPIRVPSRQDDGRSRTGPQVEPHAGTGHRDIGKRESTQIARGIAHAHGLEVDVDYEVNYLITVNDSDQAAFVARTVGEVFGQDRYREAPRAGIGAGGFQLRRGTRSPGLRDAEHLPLLANHNVINHQEDAFAVRACLLGPTGDAATRPDPRPATISDRPPRHEDRDLQLEH